MTIRRFYILAVVLMSMTATGLTSCDEMHDPELHIPGKVEMELVIDQEIVLDNLWGADWTAKWLYQWDEERYGPIGYTEPETYHIDYFQSQTHNHIGSRDMMGNRVRLNLSYGIYDMLSYNNDFEVVHIDESSDWKSIRAFTNRNSYAQKPSSMETSESAYIAEMPDQLFSVLNKDIEIDDDLSNYEWDPEEGVWLLKIENLLKPRVFIYLVQVRLLNNNGRVINSGALTIDGLAADVELKTGLTSQESVAHQFATFFSHYTYEDGTSVPLIAGKMTTFGVCGEEIWTRYLESKGKSQTKAGLTRNENSPNNTCHIQLIFRNGASLFVPVDITDQIWANPYGGVIDIVLDIDDYEEPPASGGGIDIGVGGWDEDIHDITV